MFLLLVVHFSCGAFEMRSKRMKKMNKMNRNIPVWRFIEMNSNTHIKYMKKIEHWSFWNGRKRRKWQTSQNVSNIICRLFCVMHRMDMNTNSEDKVGTSWFWKVVMILAKAWRKSFGWKCFLIHKKMSCSQDFHCSPLVSWICYTQNVHIRKICLSALERLIKNALHEPQITSQIWSTQLSNGAARELLTHLNTFQIRSYSPSRTKYPWNLTI